MSAYVGSSKNLKDLKETLTASHLQCTAGSSRSFTALRKDAGLCCGSPLLEGRSVCLCWAKSKPKGPKEKIRSPRVLAQLHSVQPGGNPYTSTFLSPPTLMISIALNFADFLTLGETPYTITFSPFSLFFFWCLTDFQSLTLNLWDIHCWSSYTSATGYHEP